MKYNTLFRGRKLLIATKHGKEKVIAPILESALKVKCFIIENLDTDKLGTFTGEVERADAPLTTLRKKCLMAMELVNCDLLVANEGSFGPHPTAYFIPADDEFLMLIDKKNDLEIIVRELSTETNFNGANISTHKELIEFTELANFPSHGLIIKNKKEGFSAISKGIIDLNNLNHTFKSFIEEYGEAYVETDMRAMFNPTRMKVIEKATHQLVAKIKCCCPNCNAPGFGITTSTPGLPCELCSLPTHSALNYTYTCIKCNFSKVEKYPNGKTKEDPTYCEACNP